MTAPRTAPRPVLIDGAVYWGDNGRRICSACAGASALHTGRDLSGQRVHRMTVADARAWRIELGSWPRCEGCGREFRSSSPREAATHANQIRIRAERRIGEMLRDDPKVQRGGPKSRGTTLPDDITRDQSSKWQDMARDGTPSTKIQARLPGTGEEVADADRR